MIDTLSISHELIRAGIRRGQADALANVVAEAVTHQNGNLVTSDLVRTHIGGAQKDTNTQIDALRVEIGGLREDVTTKTSSVRVEISELRGDLETKIASVRVEISELETTVIDLIARLNAFETRIIRWAVGTGIALGIINILTELMPSLISGLV